MSWLRIMSPNSARLGTLAARRTCPPACGCLLVHRDPVAVAGGGDGRLQPGRAGAHHHHRFGRWRGAAWHSAGALGLAAGARVLDAAEPAVEAHAADALLVAAEAQADLVGGAGAGLGGEVGVGDLAAHHADEVAVALGQRPLGLQRVLEPADADHRQVDRLAERDGDEHRVARAGCACSPRS